MPDHQLSAESATKLAGIGDSMMQGFDATLPGGEEHNLSFAQGTSDAVFSLYSRYKLVSGLPNGEEFASHTGDEMYLHGLEQARSVCGQSPKPDRIAILLGANDACRFPPGPVDVATFQVSLRAILAQLASATVCGLPSGTRVHVLSVPRIDYLYDAIGTSPHCTLDIRQQTCPNVLTTAGRALIATAVNDYNDAIASEVATAEATYGPQGIHFSTDWRGTGTLSVGTYPFAAADVSTVDCFHPSVEGQRRLACAAWESWEGLGDVAGCFR